MCSNLNIYIASTSFIRVTTGCVEMKRRIIALAVLVIMLIPLLPLVSADGGMFWNYNKFDVYESGQNAIIAWNGYEEIMILSVDVYSNGGDTKAVHVIPFPSEPTYQLASAEEFNNIDNYQRSAGSYSSNVPRYYEEGYWNYWGYDDDDMDYAKPAGLSILHMERVGPHAITVAHVTGAQSFVDYANDYFEMHNLSGIQLPDGTKDVVQFYMDKSYNYFVFDIIDVEEYEKAVDPLAYTFKSDMMFFPLKISSLLTGEAAIDLAFITPSDFTMDYTALRENGFSKKHSNPWSYESLEGYNRTIAKHIGTEAILDIYRAGHVKLENIKDDVEIFKVHTIWDKTYYNFIRAPKTKDFRGNDQTELMFFDSSGAYLIDPTDGSEVWHVETGGYANYNNIRYTDVNGDGVDEIIMHDNSQIYAIDPTTGTKLASIDINMMDNYKLHNNKDIYIFDTLTIKKADLSTGVVHWENCLDQSTNDMGFSSYDSSLVNKDDYYHNYGEEERDYYYWDELDWNAYDLDRKVVHYNYYRPFSNVNFCDLDLDGNEELLCEFQNSTVLLDAETGVLKWKYIVYKNLTQDRYGDITAIEAIDDINANSYADVLVTTNNGTLHLDGKNGALIEDNSTFKITRSESTDSFGTRAANAAVQFICDADEDGTDDIVEVTTTNLGHGKNITYSLYLSSTDTWITNKIDVDVDCQFSGATASNYCVVMKFHGAGHTVLVGIDANLNKVTWKIDQGIYFNSYFFTNVDSDAMKEMVLVTSYKIMAIDLPTITIPAQGDVQATFGPFYYNDGETPIEDATLKIYNDEGLSMSGYIDDDGESTVNINPGTYNCRVVKDNEPLTTSFGVTVDARGQVEYLTSDGKPPKSTEPPPSIVSIVVYTIMAVLLIIIVIVMIVVLVKKKRDQDRKIAEREEAKKKKGKKKKKLRDDD